MEKILTDSNCIEFELIRNSVKFQDNSLFTSYLKDVYEDLCGRNSKTGINKMIFTDYMKIPVFISEKIFQAFDKDADGFLNEKEFSSSMTKLYLGNFGETARVLFEVYDYDKDGIINKGDIKVLLSYLPLKETETKEEYKHQMKSLEELDEMLILTFDKEDSEKTTEVKSSVMRKKNSTVELKNSKLNFDEFVNIIQNKISEIYIHLLCFLYSKKPFEINKINCYKNLKINKKTPTTHKRNLSVSVDKNTDVGPSFPSPSKASNFVCTINYLTKANNQSRRRRNKEESPDIMKLQSDPKLFQRSSVSPKKLSSKNNSISFNKNITLSTDSSPQKVAAAKSKFSEKLSGNEVIRMPNQKILNTNLKDEKPVVNLIEAASKSVYDSPSRFLNKGPITVGDFSLMDKLQKLEDYEEYDDEEIHDDISIQYEDWIYKYDSSKGMTKYYMLLIGKEVSIFKDNKKDEKLFFHNLSGSFLRENCEPIVKDKVKYFQFSILLRNIAKPFYTATEQAKTKWVANIKTAIGYENFLDYYEICSSLDEGRFGQVKLGIHKATVHKVAIKVIQKDTLTEKEKELQKNELDSMKLFRHPNIVRLLDHFENDAYIYIVMEFLKGGTIKKYMDAKNNNLSEKQACRIVYAVAQGIKYMNSFGIVHRDIKPANIMLSDQSETSDVKIIDFGLTKALGPQEKLAEGMGTVTFVAPEVLTRKPYNKEIDVWSMGVLLYYLLSGTLPFDDSSNSEETIAKKVVFLTQVYPDEYFSKRSKDSIKLMDACLEKTPEKRITIEDFLKHPWIKENCK